MKRLKQLEDDNVRLKRKGWPVNGKKIYGLDRRLGLQLRNKTTTQKVKANLREYRPAAMRADDRWAMDFLHHRLFDRRKIRTLAFIDLFSLFSPALNPRFSYRAQDVVMMLDRAALVTGFPRTIRIDNGPEFVSCYLNLWRPNMA